MNAPADSPPDGLTAIDRWRRASGNAADPRSLLGRLMSEPGRFDFFQAVTILDRLDPEYRVGATPNPVEEPVRFQAATGSAFPPTAVCRIAPPATDRSQPVLTQALMGLTGPSGVLPRHYTELMLRVAREAKSEEKHALRDWFDLFNHRLVSLFYRSWAKHRVVVAVARGDHLQLEPDTFTTALYSCAGMGLPQLRGRLFPGANLHDFPSDTEPPRDLALLRYTGLLAQRPRTAGNLRQLLRDFLDLPVAVEQFTGQWLALDKGEQSRLGMALPDGDSHNQLGVSTVMGSRVWDAQSKFRIRIGPLDRQQFDDLLPDDSSPSDTYRTVCELVELFAGPEFDFCVQLVLRREEVPSCSLSGDPQHGSRLGWNTWMGGCERLSDADDAEFEGQTSPQYEKAGELDLASGEHKRVTQFYL